jgi:hypothetical protein
MIHIYIYIYIYIYTYIHTHCAKTIAVHTHEHTHNAWLYMPDARFNVCARSHLRRIQLAIHTLPAMTNTSHMHTKPSATCHYSQMIKRREALEHACRQRRDLIAMEQPAHAHTGWEWWSGCLTRARSASGHAPSEACSWHTDATNDVYVYLQCICIHTQRFKQT